MSKSKGNGIDPLDVIKEFGNDALRLSLLLGNSPGNDFKIGLEKLPIPETLLINYGILVDISLLIAPSYLINMIQII